MKPSRAPLLAVLRTAWVEDEHVSTSPNERSHLYLSSAVPSRQETHLSPSAEFVIVIAPLYRGCYRVIVVWKFKVVFLALFFGRGVVL